MIEAESCDHVRGKDFFPGLSNGGEFPFIISELSETPVFSKRSIENCQISKPRSAMAPCPPFRSHGYNSDNNSRGIFALHYLCHKID